LRRAALGYQLDLRFETVSSEILPALRAVSEQTRLFERIEGWLFLDEEATQVPTFDLPTPKLLWLLAIVWEKRSQYALEKTSRKDLAQNMQVFCGKPQISQGGWGVNVLHADTELARSHAQTRNPRFAGMPDCLDAAEKFLPLLNIVLRAGEIECKRAVEVSRLESLV
jgi:hypothetical protein